MSVYVLDMSVYVESIRRVMDNMRRQTVVLVL